MERSRWTGRWARLAAAAAGGLTALSSLGCHGSCEDTFTCLYLDEEPRCPEDPTEAADGQIRASCGIWVSASLGDDANEGSPEEPVATLGKALAKAAGGPRRVFACNEVFTEALEWPAGVALHGGFSCADLDWRYPAATSHTTLTAPNNQIPLTLVGPVHSAPAMLTDLKIASLEATLPGGSSIAVLARADARAEIRRSEIKSGAGADGADGDNGGHFGYPAKDGLLGQDGVAACTGNVGDGGDMVALDCEEDASFGGQGGDGGQLVANPGDDGEVAPASNPQGLGVGGKGEDLVAGWFCTPGLSGAWGKDGEPGLGGAWPPRLTPSGYVGVWGGDGQRGRAGQGGGGGGASAGTALCGTGPHGGAGGGSGGSGGCGVKGGRGGQPGGSSIGLATLTDELILVDVEIFASNGGKGGAGGMPQQGGQGGLPGIGGSGSVAAGGPNPGCVGGAGGYGGDGGHAGGGLGGSSFAVAFVGAQGPTQVRPRLHAGVGGSGGPGSDPALSSAQGKDGHSSQLEVLLP